jgi:hypothetical protein
VMGIVKHYSAVAFSVHFWHFSLRCLCLRLSPGQILHMAILLCLVFSTIFI